MTCCECLDVGSMQRSTADSPVAPADLLDHNPGDRSHVLALDLDHRVGHATHDFLLLGRREHSLDDLDVDEWHRLLLLFHLLPVSGIAGRGYLADRPSG